MECLRGILKQIALLYIPEVLEEPRLEDRSEEEQVDYITKSERMASVLEEVIFPAVKKRLLAPKRLSKNVVEVANLPGLYKIFERC